MESEASTTLNEISLRITKGTTPTTLGYAFTDGGVNFVKSEAITDDGRIDASKFGFIDLETHEFLHRSILEEDDVLFSMAGVYLGKTAIVPRSILPANTNQAVGIIRLDKTKADPRFVHYALSAPECRSFVRRAVAQSAQPNFNLRDIGNLHIPALALPEQRAIGGVLGALDDKIEHNRQTARALERLAQSIFRAWFLDFEPVKVKAAGGISFPSMTQSVFDMLPTRFVDSEIGPMPEGWIVKPLSSVCTLVSGGTPKRTEPTYWGGDVPWYSVRDAPGGEVWVINTVERITKDGLANSAATIVPKGCTIISARGTVGKLAMAGMPMAFNQSCYGLLPRDGVSFSHLYLLMQIAVADLQQRTHGSVFDTVTRSTFDGLMVISPENDTVSSFEVMVAPLFKLILSLLRESTKLAELRDYLLPNLLSGVVTTRRGSDE